MRRMVVTSVAIERDQKQRLDALVLLRRVSRSRLVRDAIARLLATFEARIIGGGAAVTAEERVDETVAS